MNLGGKSVEVEGVRSLKTERLYFSVVVDMSGSTRLWAKAQDQFVAGLFRTFASERDRGYLVLFNDDVVNPGEGVVDSRKAEELMKKTERRGSTALCAAIVYACKEQLRSGSLSLARRAIFVISDGSDNTSKITLGKTIETVQKEGVPIFCIVLPSDARSKRIASDGVKALKTLGASTGGLVVRSDQQDELLGMVGGILDGQYLLTLKADELKTGKSYALKITPSQTNLHFLAQSRYIAQ